MRDDPPDEHYKRSPPPDLFGPRSAKTPLKKYSPSYMTDMFGAGVSEYLHRDPSPALPDRHASARPSRGSAGGKERVILDPNDDRRVVPNTRMPPWRSVCNVWTTMTNGVTEIGTGWLAAPRIVVTAAHCLYDTRGSEPADIRVTPGLAGSAAPYGSWASRAVRVPTQWVNDRTEDRFDYAIIVLPERVPGTQTGWFGYAVAFDEHLSNMLVTSAGYPQDHGTLTQVSCIGRIASFDRTFLLHSIDTEPGQSGSPLFHTHVSGARTVIGIHTDGGDPDEPNKALRITPSIFDAIAAAARDYP